MFAVGASTKENDATEASDEQGSFDDFYKVLIAAIVIVLVLLLCLTICYIVRRKQKVVCQGPVRWRSLPDESATYEILNTGELRITSDICFTRPSMIEKVHGFKRKVNVVVCLKESGMSIESETGQNL